MTITVGVGNTAQRDLEPGYCVETLQQRESVQHDVFDTVLQGSGDAALHVCCRKTDLEIAKVLIENGANVDIQNEEGQTPLHIAAWEGDVLLLKLFYQSKANPNVTDKMDRSPLHIAAERGHTNVVEVLTEKFKSNVLARTK
ncbi:ankyrin repeat and protein kinase domain-containing protein 1-like, partial [Salvelinus sp. IW2-2015]|uniref:ankyrin repeat and protein kinase domain-containing protein 1-like n=1 Tax=Salvelinus sp. IW2-2015 TaxID=2691554 RepID=UPI0038D483C3